MTLWLLFAGLLVLASVFLIYPFVKRGDSAEGEVLQANIQIFRDQQYQLDAQLEQKQISQAQYQQLLAEAKQLLLSNTGEQTTEQPVSSERRQAKGLLPVSVLFKHALRNAIIPVVALAAVWFGFMLGGSIVIETIFNLKGIGWLSYDALLRSDLPVVQAIVLIFATFYVVLTLLSDLLNAYLDPRISVR